MCEMGSANCVLNLLFEERFLAFIVSQKITLSSDSLEIETNQNILIIVYIFARNIDYSSLLLIPILSSKLEYSNLVFHAI